MHTIPASLHNRLYRYGTRCRISSDGVLSLPEQTAIGSGVLVREGYRWDIPSPAKDGLPRIVIGDRCECNRFLTIHATGKVELKADVITGPHVYISDTMQAWQTEASVSTVTIGEGSWIGAHSSILGQVRIGRGCVVGAGSVVLRDVPDYCVVAGNPAKFRRVYEPSSGEWVKVHTEAEAREVLVRRSKEPLLSICLPVRNQAGELRRCLESIYAQTDDDGLIEVCVLDAAQAEEADQVARHFGDLYRSFCYHRNTASIDSSHLNLHAADMARGKFILLHEPGTSFHPNTLTPLLNIIHTHPDCAVILLQPALIRTTPQSERLEGLTEFVKRTASSSSLPVILNRREWERTGASAQAKHYLNPWLSRQHALLQANPQFCLCRYTLTKTEEASPSAP
ncbi:glycosyltransferase [Paenibacillus sp. FSL K6-1096]|uniref:glycosyltransferase n=1 Tax=Paenibacillus sp. FSL K6-1096 TaxID=2921460 RepID=UPI0030ED4672